MANNLQIIIDYEATKKEIQQNLYTNLDLKNFEETIQKVQKEQQISDIANNISNEVILAANDFLLSLKEAQQKIYEAEQIANNLKSIRHKFLAITKEKKWDNKNFGEKALLSNSEYKNYNQLKNHMSELFNDKSIKELTKKADIFNTKIIKATKGKELQTIITVEDSNGKPILFKVSNMAALIEDRMKFDYSSKGIARLSIRFNITSINIAEKLSYLEKIEDDENDNDLQKLQNVYQDVSNRYQLARGSYVLWKKSNKWFKAKVSAKGDIIETYNYFYFTKKYKGLFNAGREENVETFMLTQQATVDAVSGLYTGDISEEELIYDYAIKQGNASFLSMIQMAHLAEDILIKAKNKENIIDIIQDAYNADVKSHEGEVRTEISEGGGRQVTKILRDYLAT